MILSHEEKAVFISCPKSGTRMMIHTLETEFGWEPSGWLHNNQIPDDAKDYFKFSLVRNPYTRIVSIWWRTINAPNDKYKVIEMVGSTDFDEFLKWIVTEESQTRPLFKPQHEQLKDIELDAVLKLETVDEDCARLLPFWPDDFPELPKRGASTDGKPNIKMTPLRKAFVRKWAGKDFALYGYTP